MLRKILIKTKIHILKMKLMNIQIQLKKPFYKYANHPSILLIKNNIRGATSFLFKETSLEDIEKEILHLNPKKLGMFEDVRPKVLKNSINLCSEILNFFLFL